MVPILQGRGRGKKVREGRGREIGWVRALDTYYKIDFIRSRYSL